MADGNLITTHDRAVALGPTYEQVKEMAHYFARSGMFGVKTPEQAFSLLMIAQSEGLHPARAMQEYHVIQNRPTLKAEAMLGRFQQAGGKVKWVKHENDEVIAEFTHDASGTTEVSWNMDRAKQAGITGNGTWGIAMPEKDRTATQQAIASKRQDLGNVPKDAEFTERDPEADKAFIGKFCEFVADRPNKTALDALWTKYKERLASIQAADPALYDEAVKADALKQEEFQAAEIAAE